MPHMINSSLVEALTLDHLEGGVHIVQCRCLWLSVLYDVVVLLWLRNLPHKDSRVNRLPNCDNTQTRSFKSVILYMRYFTSS